MTRFARLYRHTEARIVAVIDSFIPDPIWESGKLEVRRARTLLLTILMALCLSGPATLMNLLWGSWTIAGIGLAAFVTELAIPFLLRRTGSVRALTLLLAVVLLLAISYATYVRGGVHTPVFGWFLVLPLFTTFFAGRRIGVLSWLATVAVCALFFALDWSGYAYPAGLATGDNLLTRALTTFALLTAILAISAVDDKTKDLVLEASEAQAKKREEAVRSLREGEARLARAEQIAGLGCWELDVPMQTIWWSDGFNVLHGFEPGRDEHNIETLLSRVAEEDRERFSTEVLARGREGKGFREEYRVRLPSGEERVCICIGETLSDAQGKPLRLFGTTQDITERKQAERELELLNRRLRAASRQAGMAEVATGVLHNLGNVLTSVVISLSAMEESLLQIRFEGLRKAQRSIQEHAEDLPGFFRDDPNGARFPEYFDVLATHLESQRGALRDQLEEVRQKFAHVIAIVSSQQDYARKGGFAETVRIDRLLEQALQVVRIFPGLDGICLEVDCLEEDSVTTDRHRVLQILVCLLENAVDAVRESAGEDKRIWLRCHSDENEAVCVEVEDNGVGASDETLARLFSFGFTTKETGHGFGLHSAAVEAQVLNGELSVHNKGLGQGLVFRLRLPATLRRQTSVTS